MRGAALFAQELRDNGHTVHGVSADRVTFSYSALGGGYAGPSLRVGVVVPATFPDEPPGGIHVHPRRRPDNPGASAHPERVAQSLFGGDWEYWSRPFPGWATEAHRSVRGYRLWIDHLLATTP